MKKHAIIPALLLCLCLSACGGKPESESGTSDLGAAAGLEESTPLLTIDGREVPAWRYLYWLAYTCDQTAQRYADAGMTLDWAAPVEEGTLADHVKSQALADTALYAVVENMAEEYHCTASGQTGSILPDLGLSDAQMAELEEVGQLYAALYQLYSAEDSPLAPTPEELSAYGQEAGAITLDRILVTGEDREAARQQAAELFTQLNGAEDQAGTFSQLAAAHDDPAGPRTILPGDEQLDASLTEAAQALAEGQCSGILESDEGFSILRRLPLDQDALADAYFNAQLETAAKNASVSVTSAYTDLDAASFYNAWTQLSHQTEGT